MLTRKEFQRVVKLAKLKFNDDKYEGFVDEIGRIVRMVEHLQEVDTEGVKPTYHGNDLVNVMREDIPQQRGNREALLENAPDAEDGYIKVPAILDNGEA